MPRVAPPLFVAALALLPVAAGTASPPPWNQARGLLIEGATVVTMDDRHTIVPHARVLVRRGKIVAIWRGVKPPPNIRVGGARVIEAGPYDLLFPGLINLHDHPREDFLEAWLPPSSDAIPAQGKAGNDPYADRYQWGAAGSRTITPEQQRLVGNPADLLADGSGLGLEGEIVKYAEVGALLGGETTTQGAPPSPETDRVLVRNVENNTFGNRIAPPRVGAIGALAGSSLANLLDDMKGGRVDAWLVHLAEGVRDGDRRPGDAFSSRAELATLKALGLLTDLTVIIHGTALELADFAAMRSAPTIRSDGKSDGRGAKLVWSPLSNLLLYAKTTNVYDALAEGVLVSLGTDWTPSGSRTLLHELKVADIALRDPRILGGSRGEVPALSTAAALDRQLVDMVTRNPALTLRWYDKVGSVEAGKIGDLVLVRSRGTKTVYRGLIDATERDVQLVLVGGEPLAGDPKLMATLKPGDIELVQSGSVRKAVDVTTTAKVPNGSERLATIVAKLRAGVVALGGDHPPAGGGPGPPSNTYSYLKAHVSGGLKAGLSDAAFRSSLAAQFGTLPDGSLNLECVQLDPLLEAGDDWLEHLLHGDVDPTPPYKPYPGNRNQIGPLGNPFAKLP